MINQGSIEQLVEKAIAKFPESESKITEDVNQFIRKISKLCSVKANEVCKTSNLRSTDNTILSRNAIDLWADKPSSAQIDVTAICNFRCKHCYLGSLRDRSKELKTETVMRVLDELAEIGVYSVTISGGEVLLRPDIVEIIEYARKSGFSVTIASNLSCLEEKHISCFKKHGVTLVSVALYGASQETYQRATGVGAYNDVVKNCRKLVKAGVPLKVGTHVTTLVIDDIGGMNRLAESLGVEMEIGYDLFPTLDSDMEPLKYSIPNPDLIQIACDSWMRNKKSRQSNQLLCYAARDSLSIDSSGNVRPCSVFPEVAGSIFDDSIANIWEGSHLFQELRQVDLSELDCVKCELKIYCDNVPHCLAHAIYNSHDIRIPYDRICNRAKLLRSMIES